MVAGNIARSISGSGREGRFNGHGSCFIETGQGKAGYGAGEFHAEPNPVVKMYQPSRRRHAENALFERYWFWRWL